MDSLINAVRGKRGSEMIEAAISLPILILSAMLMIRMFIFCMETLTCSIKAHKEALQMQDDYNGAFFRTHSDSRQVSMLRGGLLLIDVHKNIAVTTYLINEDILVRSSELAE